MRMLKRKVNMTDSKTFEYDALMETLKSNILEVTFTKVNGETRVMPCTLVANLLPVSEQPKVLETKVDSSVTVNKAVIRAYAIDKQAWRSFKVENVLSVGVIGE